MNLSAIEKATKGKVKTSGVSPFQELDIEKVYPNPNQPRKTFNNIEELAATISEHGLLQPISVVKKDDGYMITAGERRYRAHLFNNAKTIKSHIVNLEDHQVKELALIENIQRDDLNDFEKAKYIGELWASGQYKKKSDLAAKIGKPASYLSKAFGCLKLDDEIIQDIEDNKNDLPLSVLEEIARVKDKDVQKEVYEKYLAGEITRDDIKDFKPSVKGKSKISDINEDEWENTGRSEMNDGDFFRNKKTGEILFKEDPKVREITVEFSHGKKEAIVLTAKVNDINPHELDVHFEDSGYLQAYFMWAGKRNATKFEKNKKYKITIEEI